MVGDFVYVIDGAFATVVGFLLKKRMRNPFNKLAKENRKADMVLSYIRNHKL